MVVCTFISAPLMFVSARMVTLTKLNPADYLPELDAFVFNVSIAGSVFCVSFAACMRAASSHLLSVPALYEIATM